MLRTVFMVVAAVTLAAGAGQGGTSQKPTAVGIERMGSRLGPVFQLKLHNGLLDLDRSVWRTQRGLLNKNFRMGNYSRSPFDSASHMIRLISRVTNVRMRRSSTNHTNGVLSYKNTFTGQHFSGSIESSAKKITIKLSDESPPWRELIMESMPGKQLTISLKRLVKKDDDEKKNTKNGDEESKKKSAQLVWFSIEHKKDSDLVITLTDAAGKKTLELRAPDWKSMYSKHAKELNHAVTEAIQPYGLVLPAGPDNPAVQEALLAMLAMLDMKYLAEAQSLIVQLEDDDYRIREKAFHALKAGVMLYSTIIRKEAKRTEASLETHELLNAIISSDDTYDGSTEKELVRVYGLMDDATYLAALLGRVEPAMKLRVALQLKKITGQDFGVSVEKWNAWLATNK